METGNNVVKLVRDVVTRIGGSDSTDNKLCQQAHQWDRFAVNIPGTVFQLLERPDGFSSLPYISPSIFELYGLTAEQLREDASPLLSRIHPDDVEPFMASLRMARENLSAWHHQFRMVLPHNRACWRLGWAQPERLDDGSVLWHGYVQPLAERIISNEQFWRGANIDALTGLPNRGQFLSILAQNVRQAQQANTRVTLFLLDLDHFKDINEAQGYAVGDTLLFHVARRLQSCISDIVSLSRLGGDEFAMLLNGMADLSDVKAKVGDALSAFSHPFFCHGGEIHVSVSIGIAFFPDDAANSESMLRFAERAMYAAKQDGRNCYRFFMPAMQERTQKKMALAKELRRALVDYPFTLLYQPIVDLASGEVNKLEALIRWQHPERGSISPADFIPIAEETGMIGDISNWVFHTAVQDIAYWRASLNPKLRVGINLSPVLFRSGDKFIQSWVEHLSQMDLPGEALIAEITEGLLLNNSNSVIKRLDALREAGIMVAMDDFGTGYSSLSYLKKFDIGCIKIDRAFIQNLSSGSSDMALCEAIIVMAHKLGLSVIAEGVETEARRCLLAAAGCDYGQGYLFSEPRTALQVDNWVMHSYKHSELAVGLSSNEH
ncbi:MAG: hypothetical protein H6R01_1933 [Burkholderiaceae bacterium]|nr:hypothetical protein [Burkholderiaceae bacterium]